MLYEQLLCGVVEVGDREALAWIMSQIHDIPDNLL
jgi:hypothetical protein